MIAPQGQYHLICDLQGFFLFDGGFRVIDPEDVKDEMGFDETCGYEVDREPTTEESISGLEYLIVNLPKRDPKPNWRPTRAVLSLIIQLYYIGCE